MGSKKLRAAKERIEFLQETEELYLIAAGWTRVEEGFWCAPKRGEFVNKKGYDPSPQYLRMHHRHAVNAQKYRDYRLLEEDEQRGG